MYSIAILVLFNIANWFSLLNVDDSVTPHQCGFQTFFLKASKPIGKESGSFCKFLWYLGQRDQNRVLRMGGPLVWDAPLPNDSRE